MKSILSFLKREDGTETVEWAIIIGLIAVGSLAVVTVIGAWVRGTFRALNSGIQGH